MTICKNRIFVKLTFQSFDFDNSNSSHCITRSDWIAFLDLQSIFSLVWISKSFIWLKGKVWNALNTMCTLIPKAINFQVTEQLCQLCPQKLFIQRESQISFGDNGENNSSREWIMAFVDPLTLRMLMSKKPSSKKCDRQWWNQQHLAVRNWRCCAMPVVNFSLPSLTLVKTSKSETPIVPRHDDCGFV